MNAAKNQIAATAIASYKIAPNRRKIDAGDPVLGFDCDIVVLSRFMSLARTPLSE
tara:strand:+ start:430 stop:594 length:165 start_codon:yes stop_codon:yes gene_type:complete